MFSEEPTRVARADPAPTVSVMRPGEEVSGVYACVRKDRLMTRTGSPYLALAGRFERGDIVSVRGRVERFRDTLTLELTDIARAPDADPGRFLPTAYRDVEELEGFLEHLAGEVYDRAYAGLLTRLLGDPALRAEWRRAPCTPHAHHAYLGGLLEHTVAVATLAHETCQLHPGVNSDLLITAALVHDLGRTREFTYGAEIGLTDAGRLLGHLVLGERLLSEAARGVLDEGRLLALLHCVLSHHGPASAPGGRFGSTEAVALFRLNAVDAATKGALEHGLGA